MLGMEGTDSICFTQIVLGSYAGIYSCTLWQKLSQIPFFHSRVSAVGPPSLLPEVSPEEQVAV